MGIFESLVSGLMGAEGAGASPIGGLLRGLLAGQPGEVGGGMEGGLPGLVAQFEQAGLGHIVQSWIGEGPNHPVSPEQLQSALDPDQVQGMAAHVGMEPNAFLALLAEHLPNAVHAMTPEGRLPE